MHWCNMNITDELQDDEFSPYCGVCGACGEEGCCAPSRCVMSPNGEYCDSYLVVLKDAYIELNQIYDYHDKLRLVNKELRDVGREDSSYAS